MGGRRQDFPACLQPHPTSAQEGQLGPTGGMPFPSVLIPLGSDLGA